MLLCIQSTCENRDATAEEWKGYYTWGIKIALWTDTHTDFRKENKYLCVLEKEKRIPCMKCVKSALAHAPWRIRSSHYNSPSLCAHVFRLLHLSARRFRSVLDWRKAIVRPLLCQVCFLGRERPRRAVSSFFLASSSGGAPLPRIVPRLTSETWLRRRQPGPASQPPGLNKKLINAVPFGMCMWDFPFSPSGKNLFSHSPCGLRAACSPPTPPLASPSSLFQKVPRQGLLQASTRLRQPPSRPTPSPPSEGRSNRGGAGCVPCQITPAPGAGHGGRRGCAAPCCPHRGPLRREEKAPQQPLAGGLVPERSCSPGWGPGHYPPNTLRYTPGFQPRP